MKAISSKIMELSFIDGIRDQLLKVYFILWNTQVFAFSRNTWREEITEDV